MNRFILWAIVVMGLTVVARGEAFPRFDLTDEGKAGQWHATHDISGMRATKEGLVVSISGEDPYFTGPRADYPEGKLLWMTVKLKSQEGGTLQVFYFRDGPREENSARVAVRAGAWEEVKVGVPALGKGWRLRIDPPGSGGECVFAKIEFEERKLVEAPAWGRPTALNLEGDVAGVVVGKLSVVHAPDELGGFAVKWDGKVMAIGQNRGMLGYIEGGEARWIDLAKAGKAKVALNKQGEIESLLEFTDRDGAKWRFEQRFSAAKTGVEVSASLSADRERQVLFAPMFMMFPGVGSFGNSKTQAVLPGVEYLDKDEPSSSEKDLEGLQAQRLVPDELKITFPMMAVLGEGRYVGLVWDRNPDIAAVFDSPDRQFGSGGHLMGLIAPGSNGANRMEGKLIPYYPKRLPANEAIKAHGWIIGGEGKSIIPAVQNYLAIRPLPQPPKAVELGDYVKLASAGWLDSKIREGNRFRHALGTNFGLQPVADGALMMEWLSGQTKDEALAQRLKETAAGALAQVPPGGLNSAAVGHVRYPAPALVYGHVQENLENARRHANALVGQFQADGTLLYRPGKVDYGRTHFAPDANGNTASNVAYILEAASLTGDEKLVTEGLRLLRAMDKFDNSVPRGAQTWEMPLHTPDILGSAHLVKAYLLGYQLSGDRAMLERARYWAYTGLPFLYLDNPIAYSKPDATALPYAVIAVMGATNWRAPNWLGLPVQWCGLVYSDSLYRLAQVDDSFPWKQVADGITASGIEQTVPMTGPADSRGLLPDSFQLRPGVRNPPMINPATVQANAIQFYGQAPLYQFVAAGKAGLWIHAPGGISGVKEEANAVEFVVRPGVERGYSVLVSRCKGRPRVWVNGAEAAAGAVEYVEKEGWLVVHLSGEAKVRVERQENVGR